MKWIIPAALLVLLFVGTRHLRNVLRGAAARRRWQQDARDFTLILNLGAVGLTLLLFGGIWLREHFHRLDSVRPTIAARRADTPTASPAGDGAGGRGTVLRRDPTSTHPPPPVAAIVIPTATVIPTRVATADPPEPRPAAPTVFPTSAPETPRLAVLAPLAETTQALSGPEASATPTRPPTSTTPVRVTPSPMPPLPAATPTAVPATAAPRVMAPQLLIPSDGLRVTGAEQRFAWQPTSELPAAARYVLEVWPYEGQPRGLASLRESSWTGMLEGEPGIYRWHVRIVAPGEQGDVEQAASETYTFTWQP